MSLEINKKCNETSLPGNTGKLVMLEVFLAVWAIDSFWLKCTTFATEVIPVMVSLAIAIPLPLWIFAGILFKGENLFRSVHRSVYQAALWGCLGLAIASQSLAALAIWLLIDYFRKAPLGWNILTEEFKLS